MSERFSVVTAKRHRTGGGVEPCIDSDHPDVFNSVIAMADQELRDKNHKLLARIKTLSSGRLEIRDPNNKLKGTYDPKTNETRDFNHKLVAKGNMLTTLL